MNAREAITAMLKQRIGLNEESVGAHGVEQAVRRRMSALQWLTGLPSSNLNVGVLSPDERDLLFVPYPNHVAQAQMLARDAQVVWDAKGPAALAVETLSRRGAGGQTIAIVGQCNYALVKELANAGFKLVDLNRAYNTMRLIKSEEEFDWARIGCALSDLGIEALADDIVPGMTEQRLERAKDAMKRQQSSALLAQVRSQAGGAGNSAAPQ